MSKITAFANGRFDPEIFQRSEYGMNAFQMQHIYKQYMDAPMHPTVLAYWRSMGVKKEMFDLSREEDRVYTVFTPLTCEKDQSWPMLYCLHDKEDDIFLAETYGYTELVSREKVICVYPEYRVEGLTDLKEEFQNIMTQMQEKGYRIDEERLYVAGFHYGAFAAMHLALTCPGIFAGIGLFSAAHVFRGRSLPGRIEEYGKSGCREPLICVGGSMDPNNAWPLEQDSYLDTLQLWMKKVARLETICEGNAAEAARIRRDSEDRVEREFGMHFHNTQIEYLEDTFWYHGTFYDREKVPVMEFYNVEGLPHIHCKMVADRIWKYLRYFRIDKSTGVCEYMPDVEVDFEKEVGS